MSSACWSACAAIAAADGPASPSPVLGSVSIVPGEPYPPSRRSGGSRPTHPSAPERGAGQVRRGSLPLDGARGFGGHVVRNAVDAVDLVDDAGGHALEQVVGQAGPIRGHGVLRGDGAD